MEQAQESAQPKKSFLKAVGILSIITLLSRVLGLVREGIKAFLLGTHFYSDAYTLAFMLPNLFRRLSAEGSMITAFIPIFNEIKKKEGKEKALSFASNFFLILGIITTLFSILFISFSSWLIPYFFAVGYSGEALDLTIVLTQFMFPYIVLISLAAMCQGVLNSFQIFWVSAFTPILLNLSIITFAYFLASHLSNPTYGFAIGVIVGGVVQLFFQIPFLWSKGFRFFRKVSFNDPNVKKVGKLMIPGMFGVGIYQINIVISNMIATTLEEGSLSSLTYSNRLLELVLGVFVVSIATAMLPQLSNLFLDGKIDVVKKQLRLSLRLIIFITLPVTAGMLATKEELIRLLFFRGAFGIESLKMTAMALQYHIFGLVFIGLNRVLLTCFYATKDFKRPVKIAAFVMLINVFVALGLSQLMGHKGIALASSISQLAQTLILFYFIIPIVQENLIQGEVLFSFLRNALASVGMFIVVLYSKLYILELQLNSILTYIVLILLGIISFLCFSFLFRVKEVQELLLLIRRKKA
ncbi:MAG: putative peptidoglycan lipid II flippase [bacterium]|jgi:putative peptidoglycan lipid II flippase